MQRCIISEQFGDAIFFADKIMHLISTRHDGEFQRALYDLAHCYLLNKQHVRCVEVLQKYEKQACNLQFRLLTGKAYLLTNKTQEAIRILEREPSPDERPDESSPHHALRTQKS